MKNENLVEKPKKKTAARHKIFCVNKGAGLQRKLHSKKCCQLRKRQFLLRNKRD